MKDNNNKNCLIQCHPLLQGRGDPNPDMTQREVTFDLADIWGLEGNLI